MFLYIYEALAKYKTKGKYGSYRKILSVLQLKSGKNLFT